MPNPYLSAFDLRQRELDLERQKQTAESQEEIQAIDEIIKKIRNRIAGLLNQNPEHILSYD